MPTISANVTKKEFDAIKEYANACGETISNLIRKVLIVDATFMNFSQDHGEYNYEILTSSNIPVKLKLKLWKILTIELEECWV